MTRGRTATIVAGVGLTLILLVLAWTADVGIFPGLLAMFGVGPSPRRP